MRQIFFKTLAVDLSLLYPKIPRTKIDKIYENWIKPV